MVIPKGCKSPEASMEFIAFTQRREWVEMMAKAHCKPSPLAESGKEFLASHPHRYIGEHEKIVRSPGAFATPKTRTWAEYDEEIRSAMNRIWDQGQPVETVMASIEQRINQRLDEARIRRERRSGGKA
jgi:multiple sugar transport system substrate-binding protein